MNSKTYYLWLFVILLIPTVSFAVVDIKYLVGIPGIDNPSLSLNDYINALYALSISVAALLAVIKIIIAGVKWMLSDIVTSKQEAKSDIWGATLGLLLVISAVLILGVINPQLTTTSLFISPAADIGTNTPFTAETKVSCQAKGDTLIDTTESEFNDGGYCQKASNPSIEDPKRSCTVIDGPSNEYDCSEAVLQCTNSGKTVTYPTSPVNGNPLKYFILCE